MNKQEISKYYDDFVSKQATSSLNERIFFLFRRIRKAGLKTHSNILELGCGIGAFSFLLSKVVKQGTIEAVDISAESIAYAKSKIKKGI
ncbi:MAG: methyltransferase domain-containing protein [Segetibacter sp.]